MIEPKTPISIYLNRASNQSPPEPNIFRSRHTKQPPQNSFINPRKKYAQPKQIIIDAVKYNQQHPSNQDRSSFPQGAIRSQIDACLNAVSKVHKQQAKRKGERVHPKQIRDPLSPIISDNSIHRVDANLIMKYIGTIDKDYGLENRFQNIKVNLISNQQANPSDSIIKNPQDKYGSIERTRTKSRKSFINMTLSTKKQKRQNSTPKQKFNETQAKSTFNNTYSPLPTQNIQQYSQSAESFVNIQKMHKISQDFKYCINCEQSILVENIEYHEKNECRQLVELYKLSFIELRDLIYIKIVKIRQQVLSKIKRLKCIRNQNEQQFPQINLQDGLCEDVIRSMQDYLEYIQSQQLSHTQQELFNRFKCSLKNEFFQCINMTHKLQYFMKIFMKLNDESGAPLTVSKLNCYQLIIDSNELPQRVDEQRKKQVVEDDRSLEDVHIITPFHIDH